jgi:hypothetical protein
MARSPAGASPRDGLLLLLKFGGRWPAGRPAAGLLLGWLTSCRLLIN